MTIGNKIIACDGIIKEAEKLLKIRLTNKLFSKRILIFRSLATCFLLSAFYLSSASSALAYLGLPLCNSVTNPIHRVNCADLIDMPLCSVIKSTTPVAASSTNPTGNCADLCSSINPSNNPADVRGVDYAVHNRDCIRFCSSPETGITPSPGINCTSKLCHQLLETETPNKNTNCTIMNCNLLTVDELNDRKYIDDTKQYCDGDNAKCYSFTKNKLPFVKYRENNTMCKIHDCPPSSPTCGTDDTVNITSQNTAGTTDYQNDYVKYINGGMNINGGLCKPIICKPIIYRQYRCNSNGTINSSCDASSSCSNNYCTKAIDCNLSSNNNEPECQPVSEVGNPSNDDLTNSWFYRPLPPSDVVGSDGIISKAMQKSATNICYSTSDIKANGQMTHVTFLGIDFGWWRYLWDSAIATRHCSASDTGIRGAGYPYLCGTGGSLYNEPNPNSGTGYIKGYATADYELPDPEFKINVCLRYKATGVVDTSCGGRRVCRIFCEWGSCRTQICGSDVCRTLTVHESNLKECSARELFNDDGSSKGCSARMGGGASADSYIRVRAIKYSMRRVCTFLDLKGTTAYEADYFNGRETIGDEATKDKVCIDGTFGTDNQCNGFDTNSDEGLANVWRTIMRIPYIGNNRPTGETPGFIDLDGIFHHEQQCAKVPMRIGPPQFPNIATNANSPDMFEPPLRIINVYSKRGGDISVASATEQYGITDFYYPEIEIGFGGTSQLFSLGAGYIGVENPAENYPSSPSEKTLRTTVNNITYQATVFVKKEYNSSLQQGLFCAYKKTYDGTNQINKMIGCVKRERPYIRSIINNQIEKAIITDNPTNSYNNAKIRLRLMYWQGANNRDNNCSSDDLCTNQMELSNIDTNTPTCNQDIEKYQFCAQREECSKLYNECVTNEINLFNAKKSGQPFAQFESVRNECNNILLVNCNQKFGITSSSATDIFSQTSTNTVKNPNAYGWFNEICISSGFNHDLKNVLAYKVANGAILGKCLIDSSRSLNLTDSDPSTNCDAGGYPPNCFCVEAPEGTSANANQEIRKQTPREAGLCVDIPKPNVCNAIDYTVNDSTDVNDPFFISGSVDKDDYTQMDISHKYRTLGKTTSPIIPLRDHAEFGFALQGMNDIEGQCNGFWKNNISASGVELKPKASCLSDGTWSVSPITNPCIRYSCPAVTTSGIQADGNYQGLYGFGETSETSNNQFKVGLTPTPGSVSGTKGYSAGFAKWDRFTKTNDYTQTATASECIPGFKAVGSTLGGTNCNTDYYGVGQNCAFSGGTLPTRKCNQIGQWKNVTNLCQRVYCQAINPPSNPITQADFDQWEQSKGATFPTVNASRSINMIMPESISTGTCNNNLGFYQSPGAPAPTRECNYLGQWGPVINPCVTECDAITSLAEASTPNNGFAYWQEVTNVPIGGSAPGTFNGCVAGYVKSPYSPTTNANIFNAGNVPTTPTKLCMSVTTARGRANVWAGTQNGCVNSCPGSDIDSRIGVGKTEHILSNGTTIAVDWPSVALGVTTYKYSNNALNAGMFNEGRTNNQWVLQRTCGSDGKWQDPVPSCSTNDGTIGNATYSLNVTSRAMTAGSSGVINGICLPGYYTYSAGSEPKRKCVYDASGKIDKVFLQLASGSVDCEKLCIVQNINDNGTIWDVSSGYRMRVGETISGHCASGFGNKINPGSSNSVSYEASTDANIWNSHYCYSAGATERAYAYFGAAYNGHTIDRISSNPTLTCNNAGTLVATNKCDQCRSCSVSDTLYNSGYEVKEYNGAGCGITVRRQVTDLINDMRSHCPSSNFSNNQFFYVGYYRNDGCGALNSANACAIGEFQCIDGSIVYRENPDGDDGEGYGQNGGCPGGVYEPLANQCPKSGTYTRPSN